MSERIREIAVKSGIISAEYNGFDPVGLTPAQKTFAELIVRECADLCLKYAEFEGPFNTMEYRKGQHFNTIIKQHFGVEE